MSNLKKPCHDCNHRKDYEGGCISHDKALQAIVQDDIKLGQERRNLQITKERETITVQTAEAKQATAKRTAEMEMEGMKIKLDLELARVAGIITSAAERETAALAEEKVKDVATTAELNRTKAKFELETAIATSKVNLKGVELSAETDAAVKRLAAAKDGMAEALVALGREDVLVKVAEAARIESFMSGQPLEACFTRMFAGMPLLAGVLEKFTSATKPGDNGTGNRLTATAVPATR